MVQTLDGINPGADNPGRMIVEQIHAQIISVFELYKV
jgi:hypothetical protein